MPEVLPEFPDLEQLRRQAKEIVRAFREGDPAAAADLASVSDRVDLSAAQLLLARRYGFGSWPRLKREVDRKRMLQVGDIDGLRRLVRQYPSLAREPISSCFNNDSALGYLGVARFHGLANHDRIGELTQALLDAGAEADGAPSTPEPPLVTAASYGEMDMVRALVASGADLEATGFAVPDGTALEHAVAFGNTEVVDVLAASGAVVSGLVEAAGVGRLSGIDLSQMPLALRARAARSAAVCERLEALDQLLASGVPVDADPDTGEMSGAKTLLHEAAYWGKPHSVSHLIGMGADPDRRDVQFGSTPLGWCRHRLAEISGYSARGLDGHLAVVGILEPVTSLP